MKDITTSYFNVDDISIDLSRFTPLWVEDEKGHQVRVLEVYEGKDMWYYATMKIPKETFESKLWASIIRRHLLEICPGIVKQNARSFIITNPKPY